MIRKNRRELNSYSPSKYIGCKKISKRACALLRAQALFVDGGRAQFGKMYGIWENRNLFQGLHQVSGFTRCCWSFWQYIKVSAWVRTASMSSIGVSAVV